MSPNSDYFVLDKELLEKCLKDLGNLLKKRNKRTGAFCELIIVGGASIVLNYSFRQSTFDIDCADFNGVLMNEMIGSIADKYNLPTDWINTGFTKTPSYSEKNVQYSKYYKSYGNGSLVVRTIKDEYLLAMKVVSGRRYKRDYSDILGIIFECESKHTEITEDKLLKAIINLYGDLSLVDKDTYEFALSAIKDSANYNINQIRKKENDNAVKLKNKIQGRNMSIDEIEYLISKMK
jgi:hypothetical protein